MKSGSLLVLALALLTAGCVDIPDFDNTPKIYYNGVSQSTQVEEGSGNKFEQVTITVDFEDGDGDLGATAAERSDSNWTKPYGNWGNYELVTSTLGTDGKWTEAIRSEDQVKWMPILKPDGKPGPIKGKLDLNTQFYYSNSSQNIWVKFKVRIRDRDLHISNQIETDSIQVPGFR